MNDNSNMNILFLKLEATPGSPSASTCIHRPGQRGSRCSVDFSSLLARSEEGVYINAQIMQQCLFPRGRYQVFISHARADLERALELQKQLSECKIGAFIDSEVWENVYDVLRQYQFCDQRTIIPADEANEKSKHMFLMLAAALSKMISQSCCFVYLEPSKCLRLSPNRLMSDSPWLAHELATAELLNSVQMQKEAMVNESVQSKPIMYDVSAAFIPRENTLKTISEIVTRVRMHINCQSRL